MSKSTGSFQALRSSISPVAGPSSRPYLSSGPAVPSSSSRPLHTSPPVSARPPKKNSPLNKSSKRNSVFASGIPNPILGHVDRSVVGLTERQLAVRKNISYGRATRTGPTPWDTCRLARTIIHPQQIYDLPQPNYAAGEKPRFLLPGLSESDQKMLFGAVPHVTATLAVNQDSHISVREGQLAEIVKEQDKQSEMLSRILDLRNANRKGILAENTKRIVDEFGGGWDTGRSEVQAAIMTLQIRMLYEHITVNPRDKANKRALRMLVQRRMRVLRYLKRHRPKDYDSCLKDLGLEKEAVEGEQLIGM